MKVIRWLDSHLEEALLIILLVMISCVELVQVIFRNVPFLSALTWAEEFCRFCWIWSVFISLPYTIRKGSMLRVSVLADLLPAKARHAVNIAVDLITAAVMLLLGVNSVKVVGSIYASSETSPAMLWPMWVIYSIMLFGFFVGTARGIQQAVLHIMHFNDKDLTTTELTMAEAAEEAEAARRAEGVDDALPAETDTGKGEND